MTEGVNGCNERNIIDIDTQRQRPSRFESDASDKYEATRRAGGSGEALPFSFVTVKEILKGCFHPFFFFSFVWKLLPFAPHGPHRMHCIHNTIYVYTCFFSLVCFTLLLLCMCSPHIPANFFFLPSFFCCCCCWYILPPEAVFYVQMIFASGKSGNKNIMVFCINR